MFGQRLGTTAIFRTHMTDYRPTIGITTYAANEQSEFTLPTHYVEAVRRGGGVPILLPPGESQLDVTLQLLDGLILAGGGDIDPDAFGGPSHPAVYQTDKDRDSMEIALARLVLDYSIPTLAICRGIQVINVACGGTLHVHVPDHFGDEISHRAPPRNPTPHPVQIAEDSRLAQITQATRCDAMSWHHQAVANIAPGFRVSAQAADGLIEAIESDAHPHLIAVQWHPELSADRDPIQQRLFDELIEMARQ